MGEIYMNVAITEYGNGKISCTFAEQINENPMTIEFIDLDKARKLMWELVLAGGVRNVRVHSWDRDIVTRETYIFLDN